MSLITPDFGLLFWMTLIFGILFFVLAKWGFPIITGMVDERNARISESIKSAREAERRLAELAREQEQMIEEGRRQQAAILKEASAARDKMVQQAQEQARQEAQKILEQAKTQIEAERESAMREIRSEVSVLALNVAEKVLREKLSDEDAQLRLLDKMVDEMSSARNN